MAHLNSHNNNWTPERVAFLRTCLDNGDSAKDISNKIGVGISRGAVIRKVQRLGWKMANLPNGVQVGRRRINGGGVIQQLKCRVEHDNCPVKPIAGWKEPPMERMPRAVSFIDLNEGHCRWPVLPWGNGSYHFCGRKRLDNSKLLPYCARHTKLACTSEGAQSVKEFI